MSKIGVIGSTTRELDRALQDEDNIVSSFKEYAKRVKDPIFILATEKIESDHVKSIETIKLNLKILKAYSERNSQLLMITIAIMAVNIMMLFVYLIRSTHKAAGPVQVMNRYVRDLLEGRKTEIRCLRKSDEFKEFYDDFIRLVEKSQKKNERTGKTKSPSKTVMEIVGLKKQESENKTG